jgi:hypothetical protein
VRILIATVLRTLHAAYKHAAYVDLIRKEWENNHQDPKLFIPRLNPVLTRLNNGDATEGDIRDRAEAIYEATDGMVSLVKSPAGPGSDKDVEYHLRVNNPKNPKPLEKDVQEIIKPYKLPKRLPLKNLFKKEEVKNLFKS